MARDIFKEIKQVIKDQTKTTPGVVSNLHGVVDDTTVLIAPEGTGHSWYVLAVETPKLPTLREFVDLYTLQRLPVAEASAISGTTIYPAAGGIPIGQAVSLIGAVDAATVTRANIVVTAPGHQISVYVGGALVASGSGNVGPSIEFPAGRTFLTVLVYGGTGPVTVELPTTLSVTRAEPEPSAPIFGDPPLVSFLNPQNGSFRVDLGWQNEAFAGSWAVYRAPFQFVANVSTVTPINTDTEAVCRVPALTDISWLRIGAAIYSVYQLAGTISKVATVSDVNGVILGHDITITMFDGFVPSSLASQNLYACTEVYSALGRVTYGGDPTIRYVDTAVTAGEYYSYRVTAFDFTSGKAESDFSEAATVRIVDVTTPGSIVFSDPANVTVQDGLVTISFSAPNDVDYRGVRAYQENVPGQWWNVTLLTQELGLPGYPDEISFRPTGAGRFWLRSFDWANNQQWASGDPYYDYDGNPNTSASGTVATRINPVIVDGVADIFVRVDGPSSVFPVVVNVYEDDPTTAAIATLTFTVAGEKGPSDDAALNDRPLPLKEVRRWFTKATDAGSNISYANASADRKPVPSGYAAIDDYQTNPIIKIDYDASITNVYILTPSGTKNFAGLSGTSTLTYQVGVTPLDSSGYEPAMAADEARTGYVVQAVGGGLIRNIWTGRLHGKVSKPPVTKSRVVLNTNRSAATINTVVTSGSENIGLHVRINESPTIWRATSNASGAPTYQYFSSGYEVSGGSQWFYDGATYAQVLNSIGLIHDVIKRVYIQAAGQSSLLEGQWDTVTLEASAIPYVEGVDLVWDESTDFLKLTATGGANCLSGRWEIADNPDYTTPALVYEGSLVTGQVVTRQLALSASARNKLWKGRVIPYNGPYNGGPSLTVRANYEAGDGMGAFVFTRPTVATFRTPFGTVATAQSGVPRDAHYLNTFRHLLLEPSATNYMPNSNGPQIGGSAGLNFSYAGGVVNPTGALGVYKLEEQAIDNVHLRWDLWENALPAETQNTMSTFAKAGDRTWLIFETGDNSGGKTSWFDLQNGVPGTIASGHLMRYEAWADGWWRVSITMTTLAGSTSTMYHTVGPASGNNNRSYMGTAGYGIYIWGMQAELGPVMTTIIQTTGSTFTRSADTLYLPYAHVPEATTLYVRTTELTVADHHLTTQLSLGSDAEPSFAIYYDGSGDQWRAQHHKTPYIGVNSSGPRPSLGDDLELRAVLMGDGSVKLGQTLNNGTEGVAVNATPLAFAGGWSDTKMYIGSWGTYGRTPIAIRHIFVVAEEQTRTLIREQFVQDANLLFRWSVGKSLGDANFSRALAAHYTTASGVLSTAGAGVPRDNHIINTIPYLLVEPPRTNYTPYSMDSTQSSWAVSSGLTKTTSPSNAPDGQANVVARFTEDNSYGAHSINIANGSNSGTLQWALSAYVKPGGGTRYVGLRSLEATTLSQLTTVFDLQTVTIATNYSANPHAVGSDPRAFVKAMGDGWYHIGVRREAGYISGHEGFVVSIMTDSGTGYDAVYTGTSTRYIDVWGAQTEQGTSWTSLVYTTTGAVARPADDLWFPWLRNPEETTIYLRFIETGAAYSPTTTYPTGFGGNSGVLAVVYHPGGSSEGYGYYHNNGASTASTTITARPAIGQIVELVAHQFSDGSIQITQALDLGSGTATARTGALALGGAWGAKRLNLGGLINADHAQGAYRHLCVFSGIRDLDYCRAEIAT